MCVPGGIKIFSIRILCRLTIKCRRIMTSMIFHLRILDSLAHLMNRLLLLLLRPVCQLMNRHLSLDRRFTALCVLEEIRRARVGASRIRPQLGSRKAGMDRVLRLFDFAKTTSRCYLTIRSSIRYPTTTTGLQIPAN